MKLKKEAFVKAYKKTFGNISEAAKIAEINRCTYYDWMKNDAEFKQAIESIEPDEDLIDFVKNALIKKIEEGDTTAIIFTLKAKGKNKGWSERQEITGADGQAINISFVKKEK